MLWDSNSMGNLVRAAAFAHKLKKKCMCVCVRVCMCVYAHMCMCMNKMGKLVISIVK